MNAEHEQNGNGLTITVHLSQECAEIVQKFRRRVQRNGQEVPEDDGEVVSNVIIAGNVVLTLMAQVATEQVNRALSSGQWTGCRVRQCEECRRRGREPQ